MLMSTPKHSAAFFTLGREVFARHSNIAKTPIALKVTKILSRKVAKSLGESSYPFIGG